MCPPSPRAALHLSASLSLSVSSETSDKTCRQSHFHPCAAGVRAPSAELSWLRMLCVFVRVRARVRQSVLYVCVCGREVCLCVCLGGGVVVVPVIGFLTRLISD